MICEENMKQPLPLEGSAVGSEVSPNQQQKFSQPERTLSEQDKRKEYHRNYHRTHKEKFREYGKKSYLKNRDSILAKRAAPERREKLIAYLKEHRAKYPERFKASLKRYREQNPEYFQNYRKNYASRRRELYQLRKKEISARKCELAKKPENAARIQARIRQRRKDDPQFALADAMRATMNRAFRRNWIEKPHRTEVLLGCSIAEAKLHIERQFTEDMSWSNRASFVIDHWIPVAAFDLLDSEEAHLAFNWKNLRPITRHDNAVKSDTLPNPLPSWLPTHIAERITLRSTQPARRQH